MIWRAGRRTSPVVLRAPASCPSASPALMMRQPRKSGSSTFLRASSMVMPFFLRSSQSSWAYSSCLGWLAGSMMVALSMLPRPHSLARPRISSGLPRRMRSATPSVRIWLAALRVRSSVPSGSTMRCLSLLACAMSCSISVILLKRFWVSVVFFQEERAVVRRVRRFLSPRRRARGAGCPGCPC